MADNVAVTEGSGKTVATDDVGGVQYQRIKMDMGADGVSVPVVGALPVGGTKIIAAAPQFTTTGTTAALADLDMLANSATPGSVLPLAFTVGRVTGGTGIIRAATMKSGDSGMNGKSFWLHLYTITPVVAAASGDNLLYLTTDTNWIGKLSITLSDPFGATAVTWKGRGIPAIGSDITFKCESGSQIIYGLLQANGVSATLQGGKGVDVILEAWVD